MGYYRIMNCSFEYSIPPNFFHGNSLINLWKHRICSSHTMFQSIEMIIWLYYLQLVINLHGCVCARVHNYLIAYSHATCISVESNRTWKTIGLYHVASECSYLKPWALAHEQARLVKGQMLTSVDPIDDCIVITLVSIHRAWTRCCILSIWLQELEICQRECCAVVTWINATCVDSSIHCVIWWLFSQLHECISKSCYIPKQVDNISSGWGLPKRWNNLEWQ